MKRIHVSDLAEQDLDNIWYEIATKSGSVEIADGVIESITETFALFARSPCKLEPDAMKLNWGARLPRWKIHCVLPLHCATSCHLPRDSRHA